MWGEVIDVGLERVEVDAAGCRGCVGKEECTRVGAGNALDRGYDTGRGFVLRIGVRVDAGLGLKFEARARLAVDYSWLLKPRVGERGGELCPELTVHEVLCLRLD